MDGALAANTRTRYQKEWQHFEAFALRHNWNPMPAISELLGNYATWMEMIGRGGSVKVALAAIKWHHDIANVKFNKDRQLDLIVEGIEREIARKKVPRQRDPLPVNALRTYATLNPAEHRHWLRNLTLAVLGVRAMRRASELRNLRVADVQLGPRKMTLLIRKQKNDQHAKGQQIFIDATDTATCPVALMQRYLASRNNVSEWLFDSNNGGQLSTGAISSIVRKIAKVTNTAGTFSSHSLRIGGATAALEGGLTKEQVQAIGGWTSEAVQLYMRAREGGIIQTSSKMGL